MTRDYGRLRENIKIITISNSVFNNILKFLFLQTITIIKTLSNRPRSSLRQLSTTCRFRRGGWPDWWTAETCRARPITLVTADRRGTPRKERSQFPIVRARVPECRVHGMRTVVVIITCVGVCVSCAVCRHSSAVRSLPRRRPLACSSAVAVRRPIIISETKKNNNNNNVQSFARATRRIRFLVHTSLVGDVSLMLFLRGSFSLRLS